MTDELQIRIGVPEDIDEMMELSASACDENGFTNPNPAKILHEIWPALNRDHGLVGIIGKAVHVKVKLAAFGVAAAQLLGKISL